MRIDYAELRTLSAKLTEGMPSAPSPRFQHAGNKIHSCAFRNSRRSYYRPSSFSGALAVRKPSPASSSMNSAAAR